MQVEPRMWGKHCRGSPTGQVSHTVPLSAALFSCSVGDRRPETGRPFETLRRSRVDAITLDAALAKRGLITDRSNHFDHSITSGY
jgi:hypothetical protein